MDEAEKQPVATARKIGFIAVGGIILVLAILLVITLWQGDSTDHQNEQRQPTPSPSSTS
jgi:hypothetical protein